MPVTIDRIYPSSLIDSSASDCEPNELSRGALPRLSRSADRLPVRADETNSGNVVSRGADLFQALVPRRAVLPGHGEFLPTSGYLNHDDTVCRLVAQPCMNPQRKKYRFDTDDCSPDLDLNVPLMGGGEPLPTAPASSSQPVEQDPDRVPESSFDGLKAPLEHRTTLFRDKRHFDTFNMLIDGCKNVTLTERYVVSKNFNNYIFVGECQLKSKTGIDFRSKLSQQHNNALDAALALMAKRPPQYIKNHNDGKLFKDYMDTFLEVMENNGSLSMLGLSKRPEIKGSKHNLRFYDDGSLLFTAATQHFRFYLASNKTEREQWNQAMLFHCKPDNRITVRGRSWADAVAES